MKNVFRLASGLLLGLALLAGSSGAAAAKRYVCPPCGALCDTTTFSGPGICPACGMTLVEAGSAATAPAPDRKKVAVLVFNGCEVIDFTGPYEMFGAAGCDVYTVGASKEAVTTAMGLGVLPKYSFAEAPQPDVLVIPGGAVRAAANDSATLRYIKSVSARTSCTMSVCNGAFILANTGLLDGLSATTTYHNIPKLADQYPKITVVRDRRYVDNGKIVTAAGLSAGIDGALHVIAKLFGTGTAEQVALGEEVDWRPDGGFARAALADHEIPEVELDNIGKWNMVRTEGDTGHWDIVVSGRSEIGPPELMARIEEALGKAKWTKVASSGVDQPARSSDWRFTGSDGKPWAGKLKLESAAGSSKDITAAIEVARADVR